MPSISSADGYLVSRTGDFVATTDAASKNGTRIPVGSIVGGMAGGVVLALLLTAGWILWGKALRRTKEKQQRETDALRRTKSNTRYNASALSKTWGEVYRPGRAPHASETRVKFTSEKAVSAPKALRSKEHAQPVPRMPSTVSSASLYSAESGEEHQIRAPTSLILAALGNIEAAFTRASWGDRRSGPHRGSQATTESGYSQEGVGVAY
ncbi:hypothetical protein C8J57DRAFT_641091 [Mycena rebaudengoi]|nr:hypothetical protein C8J57DRAFT_641091 [Mycena rebaudengoi]